jgi:hypothetical protein
MMLSMRTTVTLDADTDAFVRRLMRERGLSFKQAVNAAIRAGIAERRPGPTPGFATPTFDLGASSIPIDKALRLAGDLEDEALIRRLAERS